MLDHEAMKPGKTKKQPPFLIFAVLVASVLLTAFGDRVPLLSLGIQSLQRLLQTHHIQGLEGPVRLVRVVDGDTIVIDIGKQQEHIRLIGVDTPEKHSSDKLERDLVSSGLSKEEMKALGEKASGQTEKLLGNKPLYLEQDSAERDRYGRLLMYVYYSDSQGDFIFANQTFKQLNLELLKSGWADALTIPPNVKYAERYVKASQEARANKLGMWKIY